MSYYLSSRALIAPFRSGSRDSEIDGLVLPRGEHRVPFGVSFLFLFFFFFNSKFQLNFKFDSYHSKLLLLVKYLK